MLQESAQVKIRVTVPQPHLAAVQTALAEAGAGSIGSYTHCSFSHPVTGRFLPGEGSNPTVGNVGKIEEVDEVLIEAVCHKDHIEAVYHAVVLAHPYEEPAIDIIPRFDIK
ncbi:MAG: hypothetical protein COU33_05390 [Candidatus Magasanikbacteria bacterium CG10_big_fil_rev_8_21_14_0_10_43_6]|uniref:Cytochrome C biogenesis protein n=1 Tax=Candidatus Magasanikbacteria bacterium CG10_big_fil_rev_8_21_14_0_10_43_6 TaxID=1974650 RepID=A0A2M6VZP7_9BACT|nr:MAG: hypothetical protein COU33_05390 [Candidatus Magasanikbacteria bacterium CG10_big_fil_rev_8_21_14_0_10_43_6]